MKNRKLVAACFVLTLCLGASRSECAEFFVTPDGVDAAVCSSAAPCSMAAAQRKARAAAHRQKEDITINLLDGVYRLLQPLTLVESAKVSDSGRNGYRIIWQAAPGARPVLSGGVSVTGWVQHDARRNIWRAPLPRAERFRQLYVNGLRAEPARTPNLAEGMVVTATGFLPRYAVDASAYKNLTDIELVRLFVFQMSRCPIASVDGDELRVSQMCLFNSKHLDSDSRLYLENVYEFLRSPGQWYLDRSGAVAGRPSLYYVPRDGEDLRTARSELASGEQLLQLAGEPGRPIHDIVVRGLTFSYGTWFLDRGPVGSVGGYAGLQAGIHLLTPWDFDREIVPEKHPGMGYYNPENFAYVDSTPGSVTARYASRISFEGNRFEHMGAIALALVRGIQDSRIVDNAFEDISAAAIQLGGIEMEDHHPCGDDHPGECSSPRLTRGNVVTGNRITRVGVEYFDAVAIFAGHVQDTLIARNSISEASYSGISVGYGWGYLDPGGYSGYRTPTIDARNRIEANRIWRHMINMDDGAAIYTLGAQPGSAIVGNYVHDSGGKSAFPGGIYLDEGTVGYSVSRNVVGPEVQAFIQVNCGAKDTNFGNIIDDNYSWNSRISNLCVPGRSTMGEPEPANVWGNLQIYDPKRPPQPVREIMAAAGAK